MGLNSKKNDESVLLKTLEPGDRFVICFQGRPGIEVYKLLSFTSPFQCLVEFLVIKEKVCMSNSEKVYKLWD